MVESHSALRYLVPRHAVDRPRLIDRMDEALTVPLTVVVAAPGAGKSLLLRQWAAEHPSLHYLWLGVEVADDDPVRFGRRLIDGLAAIDSDMADLVALISLHGPGLGTPLLETLTAQLADLPEVVIILDDLHHLSNAALFADLEHLVEVLPPHVHLVLSSRVDLPIAWDRHRLRNRIVEIRQAELALDDGESTLLLQHLTGKVLSEDTMTALVNRTEGWAAGLQLAGMTLKHHEDPDGFVSEFTGNDRLVADYLSGEVLNRLPTRRQQQLLRISVLDEMRADVVDRLTGEGGGQQLLEDLERESMFLLPLDTRRHWFRFHHLFRDLLRFRLRAWDPDEELRLLQVAGDWYLEQGDVKTAVEYRIRANEWDAALGLILTRGSEAFEQGEMTTVIRWINRVPLESRKHRQDVSLLLGLLKVTEGQAVEAEEILGRIVAHPDASPGERVCAEALRASLVQWRPNPETSISIAQRAVAMVEGADRSTTPMVLGLTDIPSMNTVALLSLGRAHFLAGHLTEGRRWLQRGLASEGASYSIWRIHGLGSLALLEAWCGRIELAEELAVAALAAATEVDRLRHPSSADAYLALAAVAIERGQPRRASLALHEGALRAERNQRLQLQWIARLLSAQLLGADGKIDEAITSIVTASRDILTPPPPPIADRLLALHARLLRLRGDPEQALRLLARTPSDSPMISFARAACALSLRDLGTARKAMDVHESVLDHSEEPLVAVRRLIFEAWMADLEGRCPESERLMGKALELAEQHSLVEIFVRAGPEVVSMVALASASSHLTSFPGEVVARAEEVLAPVQVGELVDPLTVREMEILTYLPSRLTNAELAERCYVSVNTIKTHMARIFRKLGASNRREAIARATEVGLLRPR
jgi:LuxR family maltose regulon positive regulatory protein